MIKQFIKILIFIFLFTNNSVAQLALSKVKIEIGSKTLIAEIAETDEEQEQGLMNRDILGKDQAMLFLFEEGSTPCFWMKDTKIPLSIAFINKDNTIVKIEDMQPLTENEHCSGSPIVLGLEVNQGWFKDNNIKVGDKILSIKRVN
jgi:uncharacterized membrane protein (UPF0127 family)